MTLKTLFLISPAYSVPPISTVRRARLRTMKVPERVPSVAGSAWSSRQVDHRQLGLEVPQHGTVVLAHEHVAGEQAVPGVLGDDPHPQAVLGVGAGVAVEDEQVLVGGEGADLLEQSVELRRLDRPVDLPPPDLAAGLLFLDDELVVGRAAGVDAGLGDQGTGLGQLRLAPSERLLVEPRRRQVPPHRLGGGDADRVQSVAADVGASILHGDLSLARFVLGESRLVSLLLGGPAERADSTRAPWQSQARRQLPEPVPVVRVSTTRLVIARMPTAIALSSARKVGVWRAPLVVPGATTPSRK